MMNRALTETGDHEIPKSLCCRGIYYLRRFEIGLNVAVGLL
jgi:hypothetical protein